MDPDAVVLYSPLHIKVKQVRPADPQAIRDLARIYRILNKAQELCDRLFHNEFCYLGKVEGEPVGYVWRSNHSSLCATSKLGEYAIGWVGYLQILRRRYPFWFQRRPRWLKDVLCM